MEEKKSPIFSLPLLNPPLNSDLSFFEESLGDS
jgi:hypothetical protein